MSIISLLTLIINTCNVVAVIVLIRKQAALRKCYKENLAKMNEINKSMMEEFTMLSNHYSKAIKIASKRLSHEVYVDDLDRYRTPDEWELELLKEAGEHD